MKKSTTLKYLVALSLICFSFISKSFAVDVTVAKDGSGNYTTVQAAINAAPTNSAVPYSIYIKNGWYNEKITIASNKTFIQLVGESVTGVVLYYNDWAGKPTACNTTLGTQNSAAFTINATDFSAVNITFANFFGNSANGGQAVAVLVNADRAAFANCRFLGNQDTLYIKGSGTPKHYFRNCYIDGNVDFIFGSSVALFDSCVLYAKTRSATSQSYITAPNTPNGQTYGYVFRNALLPNNTGTTQYFLSRPWASPSVADTRQKTVFINSRMSSHIKPEGWSIWDANTNTANIYYGEFETKFFNDQIVDVSNRVAWSYQLNSTEAQSYTWANIFPGWDSLSVDGLLSGAHARNLAVSNFTGVKGGSSSQFTWNISWPFGGVDYTLYRSSDNISFAPINSFNAVSDTAVNFNYTDNSLPASGTNFYYYLSASKAGLLTHNTDTVVILATPKISVDASDNINYCGVNQTIGASATTQTYTVTASDLTGNLTITPPVNFEVSANNTTWFTNASPLTITPASGAVNSTTVYIRLNAAAPGSYSGNVVNASAGAASVNVAVTGTAINAPAINSTLIKRWPLTANNNDDTASRSAYTTASATVLNKLYLSTALSGRTAYSATYGQCFGASASNDGNWGTGNGGTGGNLNRTYYQEFAVSANGADLRIDSIIFLSAFYNTSSNTKVGIVYSKSHFTVNDSTNVTDYTFNNVNNTGGGFTSPIPLANQGIPTNEYRVVLNGASGVVINNGETLYFRLYFACSSSSDGRYAMLKDLRIKGEALGVLPLTLVSFNGKLKDNKTELAWKTTNEKNVSVFNVERSNDGRDYKNIGTVEAKNQQSSNYTFTDATPAKLNYYRLKMIDRDGKFTYSNVVVISTDATDKIKLFPNPSKDNITVQFSEAATAGQITIMDITGKELHRSNISVNSSSALIHIAQLTPGVYFVKYINDNKTETIRFIKE